MSYVNKTGSRQLDDGRWEHCFSQSLIGAFQKCPEQARAIYFREVEDDQTTDSQAAGTAVHAGIEYLLETKVRGHELSLQDAQEVALHELDVIGEWKYTKLSRKSVYERVPLMLAAFMGHVLPQVDPVKVEERFKVLLYSGTKRDVYLVGTLDCIDQHYLPWDWKTSSREHELWEHQRWAAQPTAYSYAVQSLNNQFHIVGEMLPCEFQYAVMLYDGSVQMYRVARDASHVAWLKEVCSQIAWMIEHMPTGPWPMTDGGWHCSELWCPKWNDCKGKFMGDDWKAYPRG